MEMVNRRIFLKEAAVLSIGLESVVNGNTTNSEDFRKPLIVNQKIPTRTIGSHQISRLIIGGNPFSFQAHAEPLIYSKELFQHYFTHDKVVETLILAVENGINTFLGRTDDNVIAFLNHFHRITGKTIQWIAQTAAKPNKGATKRDVINNIKLAKDNGAIGIYFVGDSADYLVQEGRIAELEDYLNIIRELDVLVGVGGHNINTIEACEKARLKPDFYMKTFNTLEYFCPNFQRTKSFMANTSVPWIAFKVLAAGRIKPEEGFAVALESGADFLCVGMFDFHIEKNVKLIKTML